MEAKEAAAKLEVMFAETNTNTRGDSRKRPHYVE